jgi:hypothetical protein
LRTSRFVPAAETLAHHGAGRAVNPDYLRQMLFIHRVSSKVDAFQHFDFKGAVKAQSA